jgi:SAM-dependent methyltransferase
MFGKTIDMSDNDHVPVCRICHGQDLQQVTAREMMFGSKQEFIYLECSSCGCVQISNYLSNIADHYPKSYYSYQDASQPSPKSSASPLKGIIRHGKRVLMDQSGILRRRFLESDSTKEWLRSRPVASLYVKCVPDADARILDVGCGSGGLLRSLDALYYRSLHGVDPFIEQDIYLNDKLLVRKAQLSDLDPYYNCISFHHVLEHMPDQLSVLQAARVLLAEGGMVIVRIPVVGGAAWRTYRENWVQLDPPRHYYLHSEASFRMLADQAGFRVSSVEYDSTGFQFWGSELYIRGIPLVGGSGPGTSLDTIFDLATRSDYDARAIALNHARDGDQIVAILRHKSS